MPTTAFSNLVLASIDDGIGQGMAETMAFAPAMSRTQLAPSRSAVLDLAGPAPVLQLPRDVLDTTVGEVAGTAAAIWEPTPAFRYWGWRLMIKRAFDLTAASIGLIVLAPLLAIIALAVAVSSPGPVLFSQSRVGRSGRPFGILKFRSMYTDAESRLQNDPELLERYLANDYKLDMDDDPRVTPLGRFLRKSSLDELPQLWNVIRGDMSVVGPRPVLRHELPNYGTLATAYLAVYPGITGLWQVEGRNDIVYPERAVLDARYVERWTLWGDLTLILRTIPSALRGRGVR